MLRVPARVDDPATDPDKSLPVSTVPARSPELLTAASRLLTMLRVPARVDDPARDPASRSTWVTVPDRSPELLTDASRLLTMLRVPARVDDPATDPAMSFSEESSLKAIQRVTCSVDEVGVFDDIAGNSKGVFIPTGAIGVPLVAAFAEAKSEKSAYIITLLC
jgi:hypothetical protein